MFYTRKKTGCVFFSNVITRDRKSEGAQKERCEGVYEGIYAPLQ